MKHVQPLVPMKEQMEGTKSLGLLAATDTLKPANQVEAD